MTVFHVPEFDDPSQWGEIVALNHTFQENGVVGEPGNLTRAQEFAIFRRYNFYKHIENDKKAIEDRNCIFMLFLRAAKKAANHIIRSSRGIKDFDDMLGEVSLFMLRAIDLFDYRRGNIRFTTFLFNGARFVRSTINKRARSPRATMSINPKDEIVDTKQHKPDIMTMEKESSDGLLMLLKQAPALYQELAREFWWHEKTAQKVADQYGISRSTVYYHKRKLLKWLREDM